MNQIKAVTRKVASLSFAAALVSGCAGNVQRSEPLQPEQPEAAPASEHTFGGRGSTGFAYPNAYNGCYRPGCR